MSKDVKEVEETELLVGDGPLELFHNGDKYYLSQGEVAVDITSIVQDVNYPLGKVVLRIRDAGHRTNPSSNATREWMQRDISQHPGPKVDERQEAGFTKVAGAEDSESSKPDVG